MRGPRHGSKARRLASTVVLPKYTRKVKLAGDTVGYYFELPPWARPKKDPATGKLVPVVRHGQPCPLISEPLGTDLADAIRKGGNLAQALDEWRKGEGSRGLVRGSVAWLFAWYRRQDRFKSKKAKTRRDYAKLMDMLVEFETKAGEARFGTRMANKVDASVADKLYAKLRKRDEHDRLRAIVIDKAGKHTIAEKDEARAAIAALPARQASYAMQVCRLVWTWAVRHRRVTGVTENPFLGMGLVSTAKKGNRGTSRAEYTAYRAKARELGYQSMATAAALSFECCQRVWDVFGYEDPDGEERRGIEWAGYEPGERITLIQSKTGNPVELPLFVEVVGENGVERVPLYPELEEELALSAAARRPDAEVMVVEERSGRKYKERRMSTVHRTICDELGLPKDMTFTGFRHGGITEIGDAGEDDVRAVSGHKTLAVTAIYNKGNAEKARRIAAVRREHIARLGALEEAKIGHDSGEG